MVRVVMKDIESQARKLAKANRKAEPGIKGIYWFPSGREIRLIELDPVTVASDRITPFYFGPDPAEGITFPFAIAIIRPEEKKKLNPPRNWGRWDEARKV